MRLGCFALIISCAVHQSACESPNPGGVNVGFDLKYGFGTAVVTDNNGTQLIEVRVDSGQEYRDTFRKLSLWESTHYAPPYTYPGERRRDHSRQLKRRARKEYGIPASDDVWALSTLILALKNETERALGHEITRAAASLPRLLAVYDEDLYDAFEYVGLEYLQIIGQPCDGPYLTYETSAALAGHGFMVCPNIEDPSQCRNLRDPPQCFGFEHRDAYYTVDFTKSSLFVYYTLARNAYYLYDFMSFDLDLGTDARHDNPNEDYYWDKVRRHLIMPLYDILLMRIPKKIILVGDKESLNDPTFRGLLDEVFTKFFDGQVPEVVDDNPEFVQAKGVAEFVRRRPYLCKPVKPELNAFSRGESQRVLFNQNRKLPKMAA